MFLSLLLISGASVRARVTLRCNISPPWDHRRNYPLMPIHKSAGHFQSPARNSRRNTGCRCALLHERAQPPPIHTDARATRTRTCSLPRDQYTCIVFHDKRPRATGGRDVLIPLAEFSLFDSPVLFSPSLAPAALFLPVAIFVSGQLISRRRRGAITETDLTGPGRLTEASERASTGDRTPAIRGTSRQLGEKENRVSTRPAAFLMWPSVQAMNLSCVNRSSAPSPPSTSPATHGPPLRSLRFFSFRTPGLLLPFALLSVEIPASRRSELSVSRICQSPG